MCQSPDPADVLENSRRKTRKLTSMGEIRGALRNMLLIQNLYFN